jgi:hypothetical protein
MFRKLLDTDPQFHMFFNGQTASIPSLFTQRVRRDLGSFWNMLPEGALAHDPCAYLRSQGQMKVSHAPARQHLQVPNMERPGSGVLT